MATLLSDYERMEWNRQSLKSLREKNATPRGNDMRLRLVPGQRKPSVVERIAARSIPGDDGRMVGQFNAAHYGRVAAEREERRQRGMLMEPEEWKGVPIVVLEGERASKRWFEFWRKREVKSGDSESGS